MVGYPSPPIILGANLALEMLHRSGADRVAVYGIEKPRQEARVYARDLRLTLAREHLDRPAGDDAIPVLL